MYLPYLIEVHDHDRCYVLPPSYKRIDRFDRPKVDRSLTVTVEDTANDLSLGEILGNLDERYDYVTGLAIHYLNADYCMLKNIRCLPASPSLYL